MGHVQRAIEEAGLPTVSIYVRAFGHIPELMGLSRSLITRHPMGRTLGAPGDGKRQRAVVEAALALLDSSSQTIVEFDETYRTGSDR
ncbi:MAG: hypothetical protein OES24_14790 [Acidimicrobiia bacterium]|nr:hypothetical protein [Acidimicrobiia bacterium]